jgi:hypothetical protein
MRPVAFKHNLILLWADPLYGRLGDQVLARSAAYPTCASRRCISQTRSPASRWVVSFVELALHAILLNPAFLLGFRSSTFETLAEKGHSPTPLTCADFTFDADERGFSFSHYFILSIKLKIKLCSTEDGVLVEAKGFLFACRGVSNLISENRSDADEKLRRGCQRMRRSHKNFCSNPSAARSASFVAPYSISVDEMVWV